MVIEMIKCCFFTVQFIPLPCWNIDVVLFLSPLVFVVVVKVAFRVKSLYKKMEGLYS